MDTKQFWTTVIIAAVVAVIVFILLSLVSSSIGLSPRRTGPYEYQQQGIVNAHECTADNICEVKNLKVTGATISGGDRIITRYGHFTGLPFLDATLTVNGTLEVIKILVGSPDYTSVPNGISARGDIRAGGKVTSEAGFGTTGGAQIGTTLEIESLTGSGDAYACLDNNGRLFRSQTPCA